MPFCGALSAWLWIVREHMREQVARPVAVRAARGDSTAITATLRPKLETGELAAIAYCLRHKALTDSPSGRRRVARPPGSAPTSRSPLVRRQPAASIPAQVSSVQVRPGPPLHTNQAPASANGACVRVSRRVSNSRSLQRTQGGTTYRSRLHASAGMPGPGRACTSAGSCTSPQVEQTVCWLMSPPHTVWE